MMDSEIDTIHGPMEFKRVVDLLTKGKDAQAVIPSADYFRPGTELPVLKLNVVFQGAGIGDYICYMPAIIWLAKNCPWLKTKLFVAREFMDFAKNVMWDYQSTWQVCPLDLINQMVEVDSAMRAPGITMNGVKYNQLANGTGGHLVDVGFLYFCNLFPTPVGADFYPVINFAGMDHHLPEGLHPKSYVVFTTGAVSSNRTVPGEYWNPIIDHVKKKGYDPVFIGKRQINKDLKVTFPDGCNYEAGIDLRDKTSLLDAAWLMKNSAATLGLDNGMIHLAGCTNATIIAAYNMVDPRERVPKRRDGEIKVLSLSKDELSCAGCQTNMKSMFPHTFNRCLYGDNKCISMLFGDGGEKWIKAFDELMKFPHRVIDQVERDSW